MARTKVLKFARPKREAAGVAKGDPLVASLESLAASLTNLVQACEDFKVQGELRTAEREVQALQKRASGLAAKGLVGDSPW